MVDRHPRGDRTPSVGSSLLLEARIATTVMLLETSGPRSVDRMPVARSSVGKAVGKVVGKVVAVLIFPGTIAHPLLN
jgi:hypothetical protein